MDQDEHSPRVDSTRPGRLVAGFFLMLLTACASGDRPPLLLGGEEVIYPAAARAQRIQGEVVVGYDVTQNGEVENVVIISAQPPTVFDQAAIETVSSWRFQPRRKAGRAVPATDLRSTLTFKLDTNDPYPGL
jgi:TonB family protein